MGRQRLFQDQSSVGWVPPHPLEGTALARAAFGQNRIPASQGKRPLHGNTIEAGRIQRGTEIYRGDACGGAGNPPETGIIPRKGHFKSSLDPVEPRGRGRKIENEVLAFLRLGEVPDLEEISCILRIRPRDEFVQIADSVIIGVTIRSQ